MQNKIPPPLIALACVLGMWFLDDRFPLASTNTQWPLFFGAGLIVVGILIDISAIMQFRKFRTTVNPLKPERATALATGGIYRFTRNPMYAGMLIILAGVMFLLRSVSPVVAIPLFVWLINVLQIAPEERTLLAKFGDEYRAYAARVPRWF